MKNLNSIKYWAPDDKPREKLINKGKKSLSNSELIALIIESGSTKQTAIALAQEILQANNNQLSNLCNRKLQELCKFKGIGTAKAAKLIACFELASRIQNSEDLDNFKIHSSKDAHKQLSTIFAGLKHEEFWVIYLNQANTLLAVENISKGGMTSTVVDLKLIFNNALLNNATAIILAHNHPSGNLRPSQEDKHITENIYKASKLLQITLLDHLIVSDKQYLSMADEGLIPK